MKKYRYSSILGWSSSRYQKLVTCPRQYYYHYYGKHDHDHSNEEISFLKGLSGYALFKGRLIHEIMESVLMRLQKNPTPFPQKRFWEYVKKLADKRVENEYFREDYILGLKTNHQEAVNNFMVDCKKSVGELLFTENKFFNYLLQTAKKDSLSWIVEPGDYGETRIAGLKAYCKVDFLDDTYKNKKYIWDWKTGKKKEDDVKQVSVYGQWALSEGIAKNAENIVIGLVYLKDGFDVDMRELDQRELDNTLVRVKKETKEMYDLCKNIDSNIPKDKKFFVTKNRGLDRFPCAWCNFATLCQQEGLI